MYELKNVLQLTLAIIKPHVVKQPLALQNIRAKILASSFIVVRSKRLCLTKKQAQHFYAEHEKRFFFNRLVTFMTSGPSEFYILARSNAIAEWRRLMGPTKVFKTQFEEPDSIRGLYGFSDTRNATHGSDSTGSALREISIFFPNFSFNIWHENEEMFFRANRVKFVANEFVHLPDISSTFSVAL